MKYASETLRGFNGNVNRELGIITDVKICTFGATRDGRFTDGQFLAALVNLGNQQSQGVKAHFGHPNMCSTALGTYIGRYKGFNYSESDRTVYANLELDEVCKKSPNGNYYEYIIEMAEKNPDMFGNSVYVTGSTFIDNEGFEHLSVDGFIASDLVDDPAATNGLFQNEDLGMQLFNVLDGNHELLEAISDKKRMHTFIRKFINQSNIEMSLKSKIMDAFGISEKFDKSLISADGKELLVKGIDPDAEVEVGQKAEPDGDFVMEDGSTIVVKDGTITEIKPKAEEVEEAAEVETNAVTVAELQSQIFELRESVEFMANAIKSKFELKKQASNDTKQVIFKNK